MRPRDYDINLTYGKDVELRFVIDPEQINAELPNTLESRHDTPEEAKEAAQLAANLVGHEIEIEAVAFWGYYGRETVDRIVIKPKIDAWIDEQKRIDLLNEWREDRFEDEDHDEYGLGDWR